MNYSCHFPDGYGYMFSVPPLMLSKEYEKIFHTKPKSFFDCGAAIGIIVRLALRCGMNARGIDITKYPEQKLTILDLCYGTQKSRCATIMDYKLQELFDKGRIEIKSILDCDTVRADIAYCNGILTYFDEQTLPIVLSKFKNVKMLCAIHNTTEDILAAKQMGETLETCNKPRNIQSNDWWLETFNKNGFNAKLNENLRTFIAIPYQK